MDVGMRHGLASDRSTIHPNVETVWPMFSFQVLANGPNQVEASVILILRQLENSVDMLLGDD